MYSIQVLLAIVTSVHLAPIEYYASRYDHLDVDTVLNNRRMVNYYAACLLEKGPCPPQGLEIKKILPEAIQTNCARCTEKQKTVAYRSMKRLRKEYPKIWEQMATLWDPDDIYVRKFFATFEKKSEPEPTSTETTTTTTTTTTSSTIPTTTGAISIDNRFDNPDTASSNNFPYPPPSSSSTTTTNPTTTTATTTTIATTKLTLHLTTAAPPRRTIAANIKATVSLGTNIVGGIVRGLGTLGSRVVETGSKLANAVISVVVH